MINYSRNELMNNFPSITISRGINYANANRVILTQIKSNEIFFIEAQVQGSHPKPYSVSVKMGKVEKYIDGICSCHIGYNCKQ